MRMKKILVAILAVLVVLPLKGQSGWSLEECIRFALENNLDLKQSAFTAEIADQQYRQERWNMIPKIGASSELYYSAGRHVDVYTNAIVTSPKYYNTYSLGAQVNLFNGFSQQNRISYMKYKKEVASNTMLENTNDLAFNVMNSYYDVVYYEELLNITTDQKHLSEINLKKTEILVNTGLKATADLLEVKANLEKDELTCIQTGNLLNSAWISLRKAMNISSDSTFKLMRSEYTVNVAPEADSKKLFEAYLLTSPQIKSFEQNRMASKMNIRINKAAFMPSLDAGASVNSSIVLSDKTDFYRQFKGSGGQYIGLSLSIPIFGRRANITNLRVAKIEYADATAKLDQARQNLYFEVMTNINDLKAAETELSQARKQLAADTLAYQAAEKKYEQGMINVVDFYTVKNRMSSTYAQVLRSELTAEIKKRIIDFYRGNRFWEK